MCKEKTDCKDCHGPDNVGEVKKEVTEEEKEVTPAPDQESAKPKYSLKVRKPIESRTSEVLLHKVSPEE